MHPSVESKAFCTQANTGIRGPGVASYAISMHCRNATKLSPGIAYLLTTAFSSNKNKSATNLSYTTLLYRMKRHKATRDKISDVVFE
jgi:hypothetical protein